MHGERSLNILAYINDILDLFVFRRCVHGLCCKSKSNGGRNMVSSVLLELEEWVCEA